MFWDGNGTPTTCGNCTCPTGECRARQTEVVGTNRILVVRVSVRQSYAFSEPQFIGVPVRPKASAVSAVETRRAKNVAEHAELCRRTRSVEAPVPRRGVPFHALPKLRAVR